MSASPFQAAIEARRATYDAKQVFNHMDTRSGAGVSAAKFFLAGDKSSSPGSALVLAYLDHADVADMSGPKEIWARMAHQVDLLCGKDRTKLAPACMILDDLSRTVLKNDRAATGFSEFAKAYGTAQPLAAKIAAGVDVEVSRTALLEMRNGSVDTMGVRMSAMASALIDETVHQVKLNGEPGFGVALGETAPTLLAINKFAQVSDLSRLRRNLAIAAPELADTNREGVLRRDLSDWVSEMAGRASTFKSDGPLRIDMTAPDPLAGFGRFRPR